MKTNILLVLFVMVVCSLGVLAQDMDVEMKVFDQPAPDANQTGQTVLDRWIALDGQNIYPVTPLPTMAPELSFDLMRTVTVNTGGGIFPTDIAALNDHKVFFTTTNGTIYSWDGYSGTPPVIVYGPDPTTTFYDIEVVNGSQIFAVGSIRLTPTSPIRSIILSTRDQGQSWVNVSYTDQNTTNLIGNIITGIKFASTNRGIFTGGISQNGIPDTYFTLNNGFKFNTWIPETLPLASTTYNPGYQIANVLGLAVIGGSRFCRSMDNALNWECTAIPDAGQRYPFAQINGLALSDSMNGIAVGVTSGGSNVARRTVNGAFSYNSLVLSSTLPLNEIYFVPGQLTRWISSGMMGTNAQNIPFTAGEIIESLDDVNWVRQSVPARMRACTSAFWLNSNQSRVWCIGDYYNPSTGRNEVQIYGKTSTPQL